MSGITVSTNVNLNTGTATGVGTDTLANIENVIGGRRVPAGINVPAVARLLSKGCLDAQAALDQPSAPPSLPRRIWMRLSDLLVAGAQGAA